MDAWICTQCGVRNGIEARQCWRCGTHADGSAPDPALHVAGIVHLQGPRQMVCLRCTDTEMTFIGRRRFHEGTQAMPFLLGELGELFAPREEFDLYACPSCGKVELFLSSTPQ